MRHLLKLGAVMGMVALAACAGDDPTSNAAAALGARREQGPSVQSGGQSSLTPVGGWQTYAEGVEVIGPRGGTVKAGDHMLVVDRGAVDEPTLFRVEQIAGSVIRVELHAYALDPSTRAYSHDVGGRGFKAPVQLKLSYQNASGDLNPKKLSVSWLKDGTVSGTLVRQPSTVDVSKRWITARLQHFSGYILTQG